MADKTPASAKKTRRVKDPETFRQKTQKASQPSTPNRALRATGATGRGIKKVTGPIGRVLKKIFDRKPFRFIGRILVPTYFRNSWKELKLVTWPSWPQSRRLTWAVLVFAVIFGVSIAGVDYVLDKIFRQILIN